MIDLCNMMLSWFIWLNTDADSQITVSQDIIEMAALIIGVAVPLLLYVFVLVALVFMFGAAFDTARGLKK